MNHKGIFFYLGLYSISVSILSLLNILYSVYLHFNLNLNSYFISLAISLFIGLNLCFYGRDSNKNISSAEQIVLIILTSELSELLNWRSNSFKFNSIGFDIFFNISLIT